jgi:hypothetical protein
MMDPEFEELKRRLINAPALAHYHLERKTMLKTDTSDGVVAGGLSQEDETREWHPVSFSSKTMALAELSYEIYCKEMLAIVRSLSYCTGVSHSLLRILLFRLKYA